MFTHLAVYKVTLRDDKITQGGSACNEAPRSSRLTMGRGAMNKVKTEALVRGSAAAVSLMVLVSVVGAGTKWM